MCVSSWFTCFIFPLKNTLSTHKTTWQSYMNIINSTTWPNVVARAMCFINPEWISIKTGLCKRERRGISRTQSEFHVAKVVTAYFESNVDVIPFFVFANYNSTCELSFVVVLFNTAIFVSTDTTAPSIYLPLPLQWKQWKCLNIFILLILMQLLITNIC